LLADGVFHRGEPALNRKKERPFTGFVIQISEGFGRLSSHTAVASDFLREHELELSRLSRYHGVTDMRLDFGYDRCPDAAIQCDYLPPELIALAGSLRIGIELSLYPALDPASETETGGTRAA